MCKSPHICLHPSTCLNPPIHSTIMHSSKSHLLKKKSQGVSLSLSLSLSLSHRRTLYLLLMWNRCCISIRFIPPRNPFFCTRLLCWSISFPFYGRKRLKINMQTFTQYACTSSSVMDVHGKAKLSEPASHVSAKTKMR